MKKNFLIAMSTVILAAGLVLSAGAQTKIVSLENFSNKISAEKTTGTATETSVYDKKGRLLYSVKRYDETQLPKDVRSLVKSEYYDYSIVGVEEVIVPSNPNGIYFVHVQNENKLKTVKVYNGETELVNEFKKG
jgi:hypothetical protein